VDERRWKIGGRVIDLAGRGMIMGVLNVTPDSFSDGGQFLDANAAVAHGTAMAQAGADIIDVGGESTRPGAEPVSADEELQRIVPVIERLRAETQVLISIDTMKAAVASEALHAGAAIVNDVSGGRADAGMLPLVARRGAAVIIMHMQGEPRTMQEAPKYDDVVGEVGDFFRQQSARALDCGIDPLAMAFDPGIGFGKTHEHNLQLLRNLPALRLNQRPLVLGVSRKSFLSKLTGTASPGDRAAATVALTALLRARGADVLRVHDVKENVEALRVTEAMRG
jgi:dihydropteroate synthase